MADQLSHITEFKQFTDEQLISAFAQNGSKQAVFMEIVSRYKVKVYYHIRKIVIDHDDADDASQNTFIKIWENLNHFRGDCALFSWIYRIATNEALNLLRKKKHNLSLDDIQNDALQPVDKGSNLDGNEIEMRLQKAVLTLPEKQRLVFNMKYYDDLTYEQICEITGTSVGALKASYFHAVKKIELQLSIPN